MAKEKGKVFEGEIVEESSSSAVAVIKAQESAAIDIAVATANRYPRNMDDFREKLLKYATSDEQTAAECFYSKPVGNGEIAEGQGIRLAELVATTYKNIQVAARIIGVDYDKGTITAQGVCWDLESNNRVSVEVSRSIKTREGRLYTLPTIEVNKAALCSIARRNAIFAVVPTAVIKSEIDEIRECAKGSILTLGSRISAMLEYMKKQGIKPQNVCGYLGKADSTDIDADDLLKLKGLVNAVKDGDYPSLKAAIAEVTGEKAKAEDDPLKPGKHSVRKKKAEAPAPASEEGGESGENRAQAAPGAQAKADGDQEPKKPEPAAPAPESAHEQPVEEPTVPSAPAAYSLAELDGEDGEAAMLDFATDLSANLNAPGVTDKRREECQKILKLVNEGGNALALSKLCQGAEADMSLPLWRQGLKALRDIRVALENLSK